MTFPVLVVVEFSPTRPTTLFLTRVWQDCKPKCATICTCLYELLFFMPLFQTCAKSKVLGFSPHFSTGTSSTLATHFRCCVFLPKGAGSVRAARRGRGAATRPPPRLARAPAWLQSFEPTLGCGSTCIIMSGFSRCQIVILNVL